MSLHYLGVNLQGATYLFRDNKTVVDSSIRPKPRLYKRHLLLSCHRVHEAIAAKILHFISIPNLLNPADILSKDWGYQQVKNNLKKLRFWNVIQWRSKNETMSRLWGVVKYQNGLSRLISNVRWNHGK